MCVVSLIALVLLAAPAAADTLTMNTGNSQSATISTAVAVPPSVIVRNATDNTVMSGVSVTFAVASGGGTATGLTATTDANGIATVGSWILGPAAGANTLTATNGLLSGSPVTFTPLVLLPRQLPAYPPQALQTAAGRPSKSLERVLVDQPLP